MDGSAYERWERQGALSDGGFMSSRREVIDIITNKQHNTPTMTNTARKSEGTAKSFGPPTPHPQFLGELNHNQIHVRIAQLLDELRMLNIALAKRDHPSDSASDTESQLSSPTTPGFRVGRDLWYLPSARKGSVEVYDLGSSRHDSWLGQPSPDTCIEPGVLSANAGVKGLNEEFDDGDAREVPATTEDVDIILERGSADPEDMMPKPKTASCQG